MNVEKINKDIKQLTKLLKALSNEKRLVIICAVYAQEKNVGELEKITGLSQSALSQHLARLRSDDILCTRREAQTIFYSIKDENVRRLMNVLCTVIEE